MQVPNLFPKNLSSTHRLAIIGEAPGRDEEVSGQPFYGASGRFLKALLSRAGIAFDSCYVGNVSQHRPSSNEISTLDWNGPEIQDGLSMLATEVKTFSPNLVLLLGNVALKAALDPEGSHPLKPGRFANPVGNWRGSVFQCTEIVSPFFGFKCLPTYHPAAVLRTYEDAPLLQFDLKRAAREATYPDVRQTHRNLYISENPYEIVSRIETARMSRLPHAIDIEGYVDAMTCISIGTATEAFIVPFTNGLGGNIFDSEDGELAVWMSLVQYLEDPECPKILQNSLYDRFVLQYSYGIVVRGVLDDTMLKHWELYCELEKSLGVQASIYTDIPFYKMERKSTDRVTRWQYCCKDSCATHEISGKLESALRPMPSSYDHYRLNVSLLNPLLYMELRGIAYDVPKAQSRRAETRTSLFALQHEFDTVTGHGIFGKTEEELRTRIRELMCFKRDPSQPKKAYVSSFPKTTEYLKRLDVLSASERGELSTLLELHLNVDSPKQLSKYLYETLRFPLQTNKDGNPTTDEGALLVLRKHAATSKKTLGHKIIDLAIQIRRLGTHEQMLSIHPDGDGRIRCGYNIVGTETGRLTCYTSPTGSGYNLQTIPAEDRDLFTADNDFWFFQCDLAGADGWTVASHSAALGDPTMFDDLVAGIKPARVLCLGLRGQTKYLSPTMPRDELKDACRSVKKEDWDYFVCKMGQHGSCYLMGKILLSRQIFEESDGEVYLTPSECENLQRLFFTRYHGVKRWQETVARNLSRSPVIVSASGHRRVFFGRRDEILGKALAHEPQANTTYATNLAVRNLWRDTENRVSEPPTVMGAIPNGTRLPGGTSLRIEPLHQVHDALCGQFPKRDTSWATPRIKSYFNNTLVIAGRPIIIPFEGGYGPSWGELTEGTI